ncbi:MAG: molecular chaperone DnaJ [Candidatus Nanoarchaeia archaeon]
MAEKDYYSILGISKEATPEEIKKAFKQLARKYHPDVNPSNKEAEDKFKEINEAFQVLGNPEKKKQYDSYGNSAFSQQDLNGFRNRGFNFDDLFSDFGFGDIFDMFNSRDREENNYQEGEDLRYDLEINLEEAFFGTKKTIEILVNNICKKCSGLGAEEKYLKQCDKCNGTGKIRSVKRQGFTQFVSVSNCDKCKGAGKIASRYCEECKGKGKIQKKEKITIKIPKGIESSQYIRIKGKGEPGLNAPSGDLYVVVHIKEHELFKREAENLFLEQKISLLNAVFGGEIEITGIDRKKLKIKIPSGTQSHTPFRLEGQGMPSLSSKQRGDLFLRIIVDIPKLSKEKEKSFRSFLD